MFKTKNHTYRGKRTIHKSFTEINKVKHKLTIDIELKINGLIL